MELIVARTQAFQLQPLQFFVSWRGVLTLAFDGFPASIVEMKEALLDEKVLLLPENAGSKWPKTTLAAVRVGQSLEHRRFDELRALCMRFNDDLASVQVSIHKLTVVRYQTRTLEQIDSQTDVELCQSTSQSVLASQRQYVRAVMQEMWEENYWEHHVLPAGNREDHYRDCHPGRTLVAFVRDMEQGTKLAAIIEEFQAEVEKLLPGIYAWFPSNCLHVTIRGL